jgi:YtoQ family protein
MKYVVFLSGEIHSDWRVKIVEEARNLNLPIEFEYPELNHGKSDQCGPDILGKENIDFWNDHKSAGINSIRIRNCIKKADIVIVKFGEQYKQWNAAFDAGYAAALGKSLIIIHPEQFNHALKEIDRAAQATANREEQVIKILQYLCGK